MISVLTEPKWFKGALEDLQAARETVEVATHRPAILRKDFIIDEYQLLEARAYGADCVLLIVAILAPERLAELIEVLCVRRRFPSKVVCSHWALCVRACAGDTQTRHVPARGGEQHRGARHCAGGKCKVRMRLQSLHVGLGV